MKVIKTKFSGLKIIQQKKFFDFRGNLRETFRKEIIKWGDLVFDYATVSKKNVLRGLHIQLKQKQDIYVSVLKGKIFDIVVLPAPDGDDKIIIIPSSFNAICSYLGFSVSF